MRDLIIRVDDVHPRMNIKNFLYFIEKIKFNNMVPLIGVIPDCRDDKLNNYEPYKGFWELIFNLKEDGWVVAQHGYTHVYDSKSESILTGHDDSEFAGHSLTEQLLRLKNGKEILTANGLDTDIFMAPGHTFDEDTLMALRELSFKYITDGFSFTPYFYQGIKFVPQLFSRPHGSQFGVYTTCLHLDTMTKKEIDIFFDSAKKFNVVSFVAVRDRKYNLIITAISKLLARTLIFLWRVFKKINSKYF